MGKKVFLKYVKIKENIIVIKPKAMEKLNSFILLSFESPKERPIAIEKIKTIEKIIKFNVDKSIS